MNFELSASKPKRNMLHSGIHSISDMMFAASTNQLASVCRLMVIAKSVPTDDHDSRASNDGSASSEQHSSGSAYSLTVELFCTLLVHHQHSQLLCIHTTDILDVRASASADQWKGHWQTWGLAAATSRSHGTSGCLLGVGDPFRKATDSSSKGVS